MVYGGTSIEQIQLNEESLWAGSQINNNNPQARENLKQIQQLILDDKLADASHIASKYLIGTPRNVRSYQTLGDIYLDFGDREVSDYRRALDLSTGICKITYTSKGVNYTEEVLASAPDNLIAIHLTSSKGKSLALKIILKREIDAVTKANGKTLFMTGQVKDKDSLLCGPGGAHMRFEAQLKVLNKGGMVTSSGNTLIVKDANELTILFTAATDYNIEKLSFDRSKNAAEICSNIMDKVADKSYNSIEKKHLTNYQS